MNDDTEFIHAEAIYGASTKKALVKIQFRGETIMMDTNDARKLAADILDVAHASDADAFMYDFLMSKVGAKTHEAAGVLNEFRQHRIRMNGEQ